jgi:diguanylate cyclase (GGDEF)-like protein
MDSSGIRHFMSRHRRSIKDLSLIALIMLVAAFYAWQVDIFANEANAPPKEQTIEVDELLLLGGLLMLALLVFAIRRYLEQKRETGRRVAAETLARELAFQDGLTGLPNRRQFDDALKTALASPPRGGAVHAVLLLDLNGFKQINDVHGHAIGDEVLIVVAQRLLSAVRGGDLLSRFGGDEFAILAHHLVGPEAATNVALRVIQAFGSSNRHRQTAAQNRRRHRHCPHTERCNRGKRSAAKGRRCAVSSQSGTPLRAAIFRAADGSPGPRAPPDRGGFARGHGKRLHQRRLPALL